MTDQSFADDEETIDLDRDEESFVPPAPSFKYVEPETFFEVGYRFLFLVAGLSGALILTLIVANAASSAVMAPEPEANVSTRVILLSLDAFSYNYLQGVLGNSSIYQAPNLKRIKESGWAAPLQPVFPSKTFPNHYTIVTGLYTESHGIVSNTMRDPVFNQTFNMGNGWSLPSWWGGEPLWITAQRQDLRSGCMFWPGSDAAIDGVRPTYWHKFEGGLPYVDRVANVLGWLALGPELAPQFVTLYFEAVDNAGHKYGFLLRSSSTIFLSSILISFFLSSSFFSSNFKLWT